MQALIKCTGSDAGKDILSMASSFEGLSVESKHPKLNRKMCFEQAKVKIFSRGRRPLKPPLSRGSAPGPPVHGLMIGVGFCASHMPLQQSAARMVPADVFQTSGKKRPCPCLCLLVLSFGQQGTQDKEVKSHVRKDGTLVPSHP